MIFALNLLQKFGLFAPKPNTDEAFDMRLTRLSARDQRRNVRTSVFNKAPL